MNKFNLAFLLFGWFLGIASHLVIDKIRKISQKRDLMKGVNSDLRGLQIKLVLLAYQLGQRSGCYDRDFLEWCIRIYHGLDGIEEVKIFPAALEELLKQSDEELAAFLKIKRAEYENVGFSLKKYHLAFLDSRINDISLLDIGLQCILLDIKTRLSMENEEIEYTMKYHHMTFDSSISEENHKRIKEQIHTKHADIQDMAMTIVNMINTYFEKLKNLTPGLTLTEKCWRIFSRSS